MPGNSNPSSPEWLSEAQIQGGFTDDTLAKMREIMASDTATQ